MCWMFYVPEIVTNAQLLDLLQAKEFCLVDSKDCNYYYVGISENPESCSAGGSLQPLAQLDIIDRRSVLNERQEKGFRDKLIKYRVPSEVTQNFVCVPEENIDEFGDIFPGIVLVSVVWN